MFTGLFFLSLCALAAALPTTTAPSTVVSAATSPVTANLDDPSASDPTTLPKSIAFPTKAENPYPSGIPLMPAGCDGNSPDQSCLKALAGSGGYLYFDPNGECDATQQAQLQTSVWDATTLAYYSSDFPNSGEANHGLVSGSYWMGPDFSQYSNRISGNLKRVWQFKTEATSSSEYITISCKDSENMCGQEGSTAVGGYARTDSGWWGYYHYITLCPPFFTLSSLDEKLDEIEDDLRSGSKTTAGDMRYLKNTGQYFLHEMMHLRVANGNAEPHIIDEYLGVARGDKPTGATRAYGAAKVHQLAQANKNSEAGGADRASTNADSYAMLANGVYWWDTTSVFPSAPKDTLATLNNATDWPIMLNLNLGNTTNSSIVASDLTSRYMADLASYEGGGDESTAANNQSSSTPVSSHPAATSTAAPPPPAADQCGDWYDFLFDSFQIYGKSFDASKFGSNGSGLESQIKGCGDLTDWKFENVTADPHGYQWRATGRLPIGTKSCVGRAVVSAGGANPDGCTGAG